MKSKYWVAVFGIIVIAALEFFALSRGIDGTLFSTATAGIGGIVGYIIKRGSGN